MSASLQNLEITDDFEINRHTRLKEILAIATFCSILILAFAVARNQAIEVVPWGILVAGIVGGFLFRSFKADVLGSWAFLISIVAAGAVQLALVGPRPILYYLLLVPVIISCVLLRLEGILRITVVSILGMAIGTLIHDGISGYLATAVFPSLICCLIAVVLYFKVEDAMDTVHWALDIQMKDRRRAEAFFAQGEELKLAHLRQMQANSKLEQLNDQLEEAHRKTEEVSKAKSVFLSNVSHELRTPLNVIVGYSSSMLNFPQMFKNTKVPAVHRPYLELIEANGHHLVGLINDILDLSKIESGKFELNCESVDLGEICRGVVATSIGLLKGKPVQIRTEIPADLPHSFADPMRIRQVLLNLMSNAVKFTSSGSITVKAVADADFISISVIDTGLGIPADALETIFDRFEQARHDSHNFGGTGLGLDISKQLCLMHGGDLTVTSEVGHGSIFTFTVPVDQEHAQRVDLTSSEMMDGVRIFAQGDDDMIETPTVLIVEDQDDMRQLLRRTLELRDFVVVETADGAEAFNLALGLLPSLIILDVYLPNLSGWEVLDQLRSNPETANIPVVICSMAEDLDRSEQFTSVTHLPKPVNPASIFTAVEKALGYEPQSLAAESAELVDVK
ncbi:MAG: response regulator [Anaerolineae bacterium]|nr:response regulator [Anaerolineae bacterium]